MGGSQSVSSNIELRHYFEARQAQQNIKMEELKAQYKLNGVLNSSMSSCIRDKLDVATRERTSIENSLLSLERQLGDRLNSLVIVVPPQTDAVWRDMRDYFEARNAQQNIKIADLKAQYTQISVLNSSMMGYVRDKLDIAVRERTGIENCLVSLERQLGDKPGESLAVVVVPPQTDTGWRSLSQWTTDTEPRI